MFLFRVVYSLGLERVEILKVYFLDNHKESLGSKVVAMSPSSFHAYLCVHYVDIVFVAGI